MFLIIINVILVAKSSDKFSLHPNEFRCVVNIAKSLQYFSQSSSITRRALIFILVVFHMDHSIKIYWHIIHFDDDLVVIVHNTILHVLKISGQPFITSHING
jgi:uncharacterized membrane protein YbaN (DUF454 family)